VYKELYDEVCDEIMADLPDYLGHVFEDICAEFVSRTYVSPGTWWGTDPNSRTKEEIDIVAKGRDHLLVCECKYRNEKTDKDVIDTLIRRSALIKVGLPRRYALFSKTPFTDAAVKTAEENDVKLMALDDMMEKKHLDM